VREIVDDEFGTINRRGKRPDLVAEDIVSSSDGGQPKERERAIGRRVFVARPPRWEEESPSTEDSLPDTIELVGPTDVEDDSVTDSSAADVDFLFQ
jgi:hypothetical protein